MDGHDTAAQRVVPPCGACRELLVDCNEAMCVLVPVDGSIRVVRAADLLPSRTW